MGKPPPEDVLALINEEKHAQIQREIKRMASKVAARKLNRMGMPTDGTIPLKMEIVEEIERKNKEEKLQQRIAHRNETKRLQEEEEEDAELEKTGEVTLEKMTSFLENTPEEDEDDGVEDRRALEKEELEKEKLEKEELTEESEESGDYSGEDEDYDSDEDEDEKLDQLMEHLKNHDEPERVPITVTQTKAQTEPVVPPKTRLFQSSRQCKRNFGPRSTKRDETLKNSLTPSTVDCRLLTLKRTTSKLWLKKSILMTTSVNWSIPITILMRTRTKNLIN